MAPQLTVSKNSGAPQTGAITCAYGDTIRIRLASPGTVRSCRFEIFGYPSGWSAPSGWTEDTESRVIYASTTTPSDFTLPASATWGKWLLRAVVDGETDNATALEIVSSSGLHATPAGEGAQFGGAAQAWGKDLEANWRTLETALAGSGASLAGDVTGLASATRVEKIQGVIVDFEGDPEPIEHGPMAIRWISGTPRFLFEEPYTPRVIYDEGATPNPPYDYLDFPIYSTWSAAVSAAYSRVDDFGTCELVILTQTTATPSVPAGTWNLKGIHVIGVNESGGRVTLSLAPGVKFRNPYIFENLEIENDQASYLFDSATYPFAARFVNCGLSDTGAGTYWADLPSAGGRLDFFDSSFSGAVRFADLSTTGTLTVHNHASILGPLADGSSGSSLAVLTYSGQYSEDNAFGGTVNEIWYQGGAKTVDVAGSGSVSLADSLAAADSLILTGTLTGARTVTLPSGVRTRVIRNNTDGDYTLRIQGTGGGFTYLLPGQSRTVTIGIDDTLRGEALHVLEYAVSVTLTGDTVGDHATVLAALPAPCMVDRCEVVTLTSTAGGTSKSSVGQNPAGATPQYSDLIAQATTPTAGSDPLGKASSTLGTAMSADGSAFFGSGVTVRFNHNVTTATVSAGKVRVFLVARYLGE